MDAADRMIVLDMAMADVASLLETSAVLGHPTPTSPALPSTHGAKLTKELPVIRSELALAMDAYLSMLLSSAGGQVSETRIQQCRAEAASHMSTAISMQKALAQAVTQQRILLPSLENDLAQLTLLALSLREGVNALSSEATFDAKAADATANTAFVHLRAAAIDYLRSARTIQQLSDDVAKPRRAAMNELEKAEKHIAPLESMERDNTERAGTMVTTAEPMRVSVGTPLRKLVAEWNEQKVEAFLASSLRDEPDILPADAKSPAR